MRKARRTRSVIPKDVHAGATSPIISNRTSHRDAHADSLSRHETSPPPAAAVGPVNHVIAEGATAGHRLNIRKVDEMSPTNPLGSICMAIAKPYALAGCHIDPLLVTLNRSPT